MLSRVWKKQWEESEMDLKPFMNLMVVLIPMLLLSAEFARIAIVDISLPKDRGVSRDIEGKKSDSGEQKLLLTTIITDSAVTIAAKGGFLPSVHYREFHKYVAKDDHLVFTVAYDKGSDQPVLHPKTKRPMTLHERDEILLYVTDETNSEVKNGVYTGYGEALTDAQGKFIDQVRVGDSVYAMAQPRRLTVVKNIDDFTIRPLSVYDVVKNHLIQVKQRFKDAQDHEDLIIAAENDVKYDKIVQLMDVARESRFPNISIAKLRG